MKFAKIDADGFIQGFFDPHVHSDIPNDCLEITDETWEQLLDDSKKWNGTEWVTFDPRDYVSDTLRWQKLRIFKNQVLSSSDWTQIPDAPLTTEQKTSWAAWRQQVRDVPQNFPNLRDAEAELSRLFVSKP
jgi:hypothetical protein